MPPVNLQQFCGDDPYRPYLGKPFTEGDYTFATNGHLIVRVPKIDGVGPADREEPVNASRIFERLPAFQQFDRVPTYALPSLDGPETVECESCLGRGKEHDCPDCGCTCDECNGTGEVTREKSVSTTFFGIIVQLRYVRKILNLPGVEIARGSAVVTERSALPLLFRFEGGDGALMPMRSRYDNHIQIKEVA